MSMDCTAALAAEFPLLLPTDLSLRSYHGFVQVQGVSYRVSFALPEGARAGVHASLSGSRVECEPRLHELLQGQHGPPLPSLPPRRTLHHAPQTPQPNG